MKEYVKIPMLVTYLLPMKSIFQLKQYLFVRIFLTVRKKDRNKFLCDFGFEVIV
jgi:hypothetical protein